MEIFARGRLSSWSHSRFNQLEKNQQDAHARRSIGQFDEATFRSISSTERHSGVVRCCSTVNSLAPFPDG